LRIKKFLPNPFVLENQNAITLLDQWETWRNETREIILELEYGTMPQAPEETIIEYIETEKLEEKIIF
jgi:hypothetical protein